MDYGYDPRMPRMQIPTLPVATISTGVSLTDRFKHYQQSHVAEEREIRRPVGGIPTGGYGLPAGLRPNSNIYGGQRRQYPIPSLIPTPTVSQRNRQLALALAKRAMNPPVVQNSRLGIPTRQRGLAALGTPRLGVRRGGTRAMPGRGQGLNQIQKSPGFIHRAGNKGGKLRGGVNQSLASRVSRGGPRGGGGRSRGGNNVRGRGGRRGGGGRGGKVAGKEVAPSKEALDTELDSYMSHSKAYLDRQLDDYMLKAKEAQAAAQAGIVLNETADDDVTMADVTL